jgi:hypothetical protein
MRMRYENPTDSRLNYANVVLIVRKSAERCFKHEDAGRYVISNTEVARTYVCSVSSGPSRPHARALIGHCSEVFGSCILDHDEMPRRCPSSETSKLLQSQTTTAVLRLFYEETDSVRATDWGRSVLLTYYSRSYCQQHNE